MTLLDPKFAKIVALMNSTEHAGEKQSARMRAGAVAASCGMTFDEAMDAMRRPPAAPFVNVMEGFGDFMERREPGWKARDAAARSEKERQRLRRRIEILERFGSKDAALAPCVRERLLLEAVKAWRKPCRRPYQRWTESLDGCTSVYFGKMPARVIDAIKSAYPMPSTFQEAKTEYDYWVARRQELEDVMGPGEYGDSGLDLVPEIRMDMVRDLAERDLQVTTLVDLHARFAMYRGNENHNADIEAALFRDLEAIMRATGHPSNLSMERSADARTSNGGIDIPILNPKNHPSASVQEVATMLRADSGRSDRDIARACGCSPTTVGKIRRDLGLV